MLKFLRKDNQLTVNVDGKPCTVEELAERKEELIGCYMRESDVERSENLIVELAQVNSGLKALTAAEASIQEIRSELALRKAKQKADDMAYLATSNKKFKEDLMMITHAMMKRHSRVRVVWYDEEENRDYREAANSYYASLFETLSQEDAHAQADEIMTAGVKKRAWKELVTLPAVPAPLSVQKAVGAN